MTNKYEINLNLIPYEGESFQVSADEISQNKALSEISLPDAKNSINLTVLPIGEQHFEIKFSVYLKRSLDCTRCGEPFNSSLSKEFKEYLSLNSDSEGEDQGFILLDSPKWNFLEFIRESVELEKPYQTYKYGEKCLESCEHYEKAVKLGWISKKSPNASPFKALKELKNKLN